MIDSGRQRFYNGFGIINRWLCIGRVGELLMEKMFVLFARFDLMKLHFGNLLKMTNAVRKLVSFFKRIQLDVTQYLSRKYLYEEINIWGLEIVFNR
jgi:hypothetical protein